MYLRWRLTQDLRYNSVRAPVTQLERATAFERANSIRETSQIP